MELFFGATYRGIEEKSVSLPKIDEEEKCQPVDEKEESDVVSQADDASQEEDIEEESIPEEDEENTPHVAGIDDAAMGVKYRPGRQHLRWKKDIELEEYGRFVLAQLMWINLRRMPSVCPMSPLDLSTRGGRMR